MYSNKTRQAYSLLFKAGEGSGIDLDGDFKGTPKPASDAKTAEEIAAEKAVADEAAAAKAKLEEEEAAVAAKKAEEEGAAPAELKAGEVITIGDDEFTIDDKGNAVDSAGTIKFTKEELAEDETDAADAADGELSIEAIEALSGIKVVKDGNPVVFEATADGLAKRELAIVEQTQIEAKKSAVVDFFNANSDLMAAYQHHVVHGNLNEFNKKSAYADLDIKTATLDTKSDVVKSDLIARGNTPEQAATYLKYLIDNSLLDGEFKSAIANIKSAKVAADKKVAADYTAALQAEADKQAQFKTEVSTIIDGGTIKGLKIPDTFIRMKGNTKVTATRAELVAYLTEPKYEDAQGKTFSQYEYEKELKEFNTEDEVYDGLNMFLGSTDLINKLKEDKIKKKIIFKRKATKKVIPGSGRIANASYDKIKLD